MENVRVYVVWGWVLGVYYGFSSRVGYCCCIDFLFGFFKVWDFKNVW